MSLPAPWAAYIANYSDATKLYDYTGNNRHATISGTAPVLNKQSGYGASASIPSLTGCTSTQITWPSGSIPTNFTICSITRYAGGSRQRILTGQIGQNNEQNWLQGHWGSRTGVAFYNRWNTAETGENITDWVVMCGKNGLVYANNVNKTNIATATYGNPGGHTLTINGFVINNALTEQSDFGFQQLIIWNTELTQTQIVSISTYLMTYLTDGDITKFPWYNSGNFSLIPRQSNYYKTTNNIQTSIYPTLEFAPYIIKFVTANPINNVSNPYKTNDSYIFSSILKTPYTPDFSGIDEKPSTVGYSVGGTDISTWTIAPYVDINTFPTFSTSNIPSWCKAIRVIMIGGGGAKAPDINVAPIYVQNNTEGWTKIEGVASGQGWGPYYQDAGDANKGEYFDELWGQNQGHRQHQGDNHNMVISFNRNYDFVHGKNYHYYVNYTWERHQNKGNQVLHEGNQQTGGGGGGGGAVYIASISTQMYSQIQITGTSSLTLRLNGSNVITCGNGSDGGSAQQGGAGGSVTTAGGFTPDFKANGGNGQGNGSGGVNGFNNAVNYSTTLNYGKGGNGPYYRVYFLTN